MVGVPDPTVEQIREAVSSVGGKASAARITHRQWTTVHRWCTGETTIPPLAWVVLSEAAANE